MEELNYTIEAQKTRFFLTLALFVTVITIELYLIIENQGQTDLMLRVVIIALFFLVIYRYLSMPKEIRVENDLVYFKNWFGKEKAAYIKDFRKIIKRLGNTTIFLEDKVIRLASGFDDFRKFCDDVQKRNPDVLVIGVK
ncbi:MAG: hypothetical protein WB996_08435 [Ignavibacteriaceae bacterium]